MPKEADVDTGSLDNLPDGPDVEEACADMMEPDDHEVSDIDSDVGTIDEGPCELPEDLQSDLHLTNPRKWLEALSAPEQAVIESSAIYKSIPGPTQGVGLDECLSLLNGAYRDYRRLLGSHYRGDGIDAVVASQLRPNVAYLRRVSSDIYAIREHLASRQAEHCLNMLRNWGFNWTYASIEGILNDDCRDRSCEILGSCSHLLLGSPCGALR